MKILVIEDSDRLRESINLALRKSGYAVDAAADGEEGFWMAESGGYDVIVLDLPHLFELLWRKDVSRTSNSHSGLGLAVAKRFSDLLGIELACSLPEEDLFQVTITIPTAHPQSG